MKLSYSVIATALLSMFSVSAFAGDVNIYGKANLTVQSSDDGEGFYTEVKSNASRIGLKGGHDLGNDLEVIFKAEFQVDLDGDSEKGKSITDRNQYIGLKGNFGEVLLGINDTVLKQSQGKVDLFSDLNGDIKTLWKGENRMSDTITYKSPKVNGLQLGVTYIAEDAIDTEDGTSIALFYGDSGLKKSTFYAAIAIDSEVKGYDTKRFTVQGKLAGFTLGAIAHTQEKVSNGSEVDGFLFSAKYGFDKVTVKAQLQTAEYDGGDDRSGMTLGADYALAKSTKLFAFYTTFDMDSAADEDYLAVGLEYKF
ncbi:MULTISPECIES: porin [unclassified Colwellia]|uniref:porin n=1 Tax=unclassified Colwellia TaxID=196834 RepID=UPI0015F65DC6|nr:MULTISPECIES: porin [unclassified Colwellia]MBA6230727.1 porin [Colwellia sp. MB02u-7]MBA6234658.1 porin [Colwellia sp. MB02u-11]MBA6255522.1 porin [Colwellia sp. MB3u-28]MBA6261662.1 porin [Colwellia sp. MB3u-41]MBA6301212.1 porin [Colwellia sp. MB3u-22]